MKNQKNLRLQVRLQTGRLAQNAGLNQNISLAITLPLFPARKIPVTFHPKFEESLVIKHIAPVHFSDRR
jgi:hypothetical protein